MERHEHGGIDKRLSRIDRWLKRCMAACRCGSWNSALMEIECMEAEARECREELWGIATEEAEGRVRRPLSASVFLGVRAVVLALVMVMAVGFPLSVDQDLPFGGFGSQGSSIAVLTSTESDILEALRSSLSNRNASRVVLTLDRAEDEGAASLPRGAALAGEEPSRGATGGVPARQSTSRGMKNSKSDDSRGLAAAASRVDTSAKPSPAKEPSVEEVISLIQVGQRALRISEPAVKVVP